jgi:hypothetical protein
MQHKSLQTVGLHVLFPVVYSVGHFTYFAVQFIPTLLTTDFHRLYTD